MSGRKAWLAAAVAAATVGIPLAVGPWPRLLAGGGTTQRAATRPAGGVVIDSLKGTATVRRTDGREVAAAQGMALVTDEVITVGPAGEVDLRLGEGDRLRLTGGSSFRVGQAAAQGPRFDLLKGDLLARVSRRPAGGQVVVRTPTGVAGVEGTTFRVHVEGESQATEVAVTDGTVRLAGVDELNKYVAVGEGQSARLAPWKEAVLRATGSGVVAGPPAGGPPVGEAAPALVVTAGVVIPTDAPSPEAAEAAALEQARTQALAALTNRLTYHRISADQTLGALLLAKEGTLRRAADYAAGAKVTDRRRTDDGRLVIDLTLDLKGLGALVGGGEGFFATTIRELTRVEFGQAFGGQQRLMAEGAARMDAQRKLVEVVRGIVVDAATTVRDLVAADDTIRVRTEGLLRGAKVVATRYLADGTVEVDMEVTGETCLAALDPEQTGRFGRHYLSAPQAVSLTDLVWFHGFAN